MQRTNATGQAPSEGERRLAYIADMNLAQRAWEENSLEDVTRLLEENRDNPERNFEWYYWHRRCYAHTQALLDPLPPDSFRAACFSPDRKRIAMCGNSVACIWDTATRKRLLTLRGHKDIVACVAFSPDGRMLATGSHDGSAKIWDATTGRLLRTLADAKPEAFHTILTIAFSANGKRIATGGIAGSTKVWEVETGAELLTLSGDLSTEVIKVVAFSPDDTQILICSEDQAQIWNAADGKPQFMLGPMRRNLDHVVAAFSKDGSRLLIHRGDPYADDGPYTDVWNAATGEKLLSLPDQKTLLSAAAFSPDGSMLAIADFKGALKIVDMYTGATLQSTTAPTRRFAFSADGTYLYAAGEKEIRTFASRNLEEKPTLRDEEHLQISAVSPDHRLLATSAHAFSNPDFGASDSELTLRDMASGRVLRTLKAHRGDIQALLFTRDGKRIVSAGEDGNIKIWDSATGQCLRTIKGEEAIKAMDCSPDGRQIVTGDGEGMLAFWDAATGKPLAKIKGHDKEMRSIRFSPDGKLLATVGWDDKIKIWDAVGATTWLGKQAVVKEFSNASSAHIFGGIPHFAVFSPDSRTLLVSDDAHGETVLWSVKSYQRLLTLHGSRVGRADASFSPDGKRIVTADSDGIARIYDTATGREVLRLKHKHFLNSALFSNDGREIVTVSGSDTITVWQSDYPARSVLPRGKTQAYAH